MKTLKNISQYNWNWWFVISIFLLFSTLFTATVINGNPIATVAIVITSINMLGCLYTGGMSNDEDDEDIISDEEYHKWVQENLINKSCPIKTQNKNEEIVFEESFTKREVVQLLLNGMGRTDDMRCELDKIAVGFSTTNASTILEKYNKDKWIAGALNEIIQNRVKIQQ